MSLTRNKALALLLAGAAPLAGCLATMNGAFKVHGVAPGRCVLEAENLGTHRKEHWDVAGEFTETVIAAEPNPSAYDLTLVCEGQVKQSLHGVRPSYEHWQHPVELGGV